ncbi:MAG TPA: mechanosensitive ion channel [Burkholderiaceae bacterium]|nr:mechanosensitive ion channel [Burkholderiaceae bacterium]
MREAFKAWLWTWLEAHAPGYAQLGMTAVALAWIGLVALALHFILHRLMMRLVGRLDALSGKGWRRILFGHHFFRRLAFVIQGAVVQIQGHVWLEPGSALQRGIDVASNLWMLLFALLALFSFLESLHSFVRSGVTKISFPLRGLIQTLKLILSALFGIVAISMLIGKSPFILLGGLSALSAVLMLVFKDPILGLVAGIQLTVNDMLAVGDWLEMPKYGADGDVIEIGLATVKVRNWDKTITTVPTYTLVSDSFKNWRGMSESGGRRIKRSVLIDIHSIGFLSKDDLARLKAIAVLRPYLEKKTEEIERFNAQAQADTGQQVSAINGRRLTNIGTFRAYLTAYLKQHPRIRSDMTLMVRQLDPTPNGLPLEIYAFTHTTDWHAYEDIQSDIFDHLLAVLPEFGLRAHEAPTGSDIRSLGPVVANMG